MFFASLFFIVLLLPRISATAAPLTGQDNYWLSQSSSCPAYYVDAEMAPSTTIRSYEFNSSDYDFANQWGWQENGATSSSYQMDWYQFVQATQNEPKKNSANIGTAVDFELYSKSGMYSYDPGDYKNTTYYMGTAGAQAYTDVITNGLGDAESVLWQDYAANGTLLISTTDTWPNMTQGQTTNNPIQNFQNVFVGKSVGDSASKFSYADFYSGAGQWTFTGPTSIDDSNSCNMIDTGENSEMNYSTPSCGTQGGQGVCTQTFSAPSGYEGNSNNGHFTVDIKGGWGTTTQGVIKGTLLVASEATYTGGITFNTPNDTFGDTWTHDGGGTYCGTYDCVSMWHTVAKNNGFDNVTFHSTNTVGYTYGFVREFLNYSGTVDKSKTNSGTSGTPSVASFSLSSGDLIVSCGRY